MRRDLAEAVRAAVSVEVMSRFDELEPIAPAAKDGSRAWTCRFEDGRRMVVELAFADEQRGVGHEYFRVLVHRVKAWPPHPNAPRSWVVRSVGELMENPADHVEFDTGWLIEGATEEPHVWWVSDAPTEAQTAEARAAAVSEGGEPMTVARARVPAMVTAAFDVIDDVLRQLPLD